jgi:LysM repeat protein
MKRRSLVLLVLTILFLAVLLFFVQSRKADVVSYVLPDWELPIDTSQVLKITIQKEAGPITFERKRGLWRLEQGDRLVAANSVTSHLLAGIADFRLLGLVSSNPRKQDLFEVGATGTRIVIATDLGKEVSLIVGKMSTLPSRSYVRPTNSNMVFLASGLTREVIGGETDYGRTFHLDSAFILSISIEIRNESFTLHRQGRLWLFDQNPVPPGIMQPAVASLQEFRTEGLGDVDIRPNEKPVLSLEIQGQRRERLDFYQASVNNKSYIVKTPFSPRTYSVDVATVGPLLHLANFMSSWAYNSSQPKAGSQANDVSEQRATAGGGFPSREDVTYERPVSSQLQQSLPQNSNDAMGGNGAEDEGVLSIHKVKFGETLESIAQLYNTTKDKLKQWNLLNGDVVPVGAELYVFVRR